MKASRPACETPAASLVSPSQWVVCVGAQACSKDVSAYKNSDRRFLHFFTVGAYEQDELIETHACCTGNFADPRNDSPGTGNGAGSEQFTRGCRRNRRHWYPRVTRVVAESQARRPGRRR